MFIVVPTPLNISTISKKDDLLKFKPGIRIGKKRDFSDLECGMFVRLYIRHYLSTVSFMHSHIQG